MAHRPSSGAQKVRAAEVSGRRAWPPTLMGFPFEHGLHTLVATRLADRLGGRPRRPHSDDPDMGAARPRQPIELAEAASDRYGWPLHVIEESADEPARDQPQAFLRALDAVLGGAATGR